MSSAECQPPDGLRQDSRSLKRLKQAQRADWMLALTREQRLQAVGAGPKPSMIPVTVKLNRLSAEYVCSATGCSASDKLDAKGVDMTASAGDGGKSKKMGAKKEVASPSDPVDAVVQSVSKKSCKHKTDEVYTKGVDMTASAVFGDGGQSGKIGADGESATDPVDIAVQCVSKKSRKHNAGEVDAKGVNMITSSGCGDVGQSRKMGANEKSATDPVDIFMRHVLKKSRKHNADEVNTKGVNMVTTSGCGDGGQARKMGADDVSATDPVDIAVRHVSMKSCKRKAGHFLDKGKSGGPQVMGRQTTEYPSSTAAISSSKSSIPPSTSSTVLPPPQSGNSPKVTDTLSLMSTDLAAHYQDRMSTLAASNVTADKDAARQSEGIKQNKVQPIAVTPTSCNVAASTPTVTGSQQQVYNGSGVTTVGSFGTEQQNSSIMGDGVGQTSNYSCYDGANGGYFPPGKSSDSLPTNSWPGNPGARGKIRGRQGRPRGSRGVGRGHNNHPADVDTTVDHGKRPGCSGRRFRSRGVRGDSRSSTNSLHHDVVDGSNAMCSTTYTNIAQQFLTASAPDVTNMYQDPYSANHAGELNLRILTHFYIQN